MSRTERQSAVGGQDAKVTHARFVRYRATHDRALRDELLVEHRWLVYYCANRFARRGEPVDDLVQVAQLGMLKAIERYDPTFGVSFAGFAMPTMAGEIKRYFRDATWAVRVSRRASDLLARVGSAVETLNQQLQRAPTVREIADHLHVTDEDVLAALEARQAYRSQPLAPPAHDEGRAERPQTAIEDADLDPDQIAIRLAIEQLPADDQRIVYLRFYEDLTQAEIASRIGTSQVQVSRRLRRIYQRLGTDFEPPAVSQGA